MILIKPGTRSKRLVLQDALRKRHENIRESVQTEIDKRVKRGIPLNDDIDWATVQAAARDEDENIGLLIPDGLEAIDEFQPNERLEGLTFECNVLSRLDTIAIVETMPLETATRFQRLQEALVQAEFSLFGVKDIEGNDITVSAEDIMNLGIASECYFAMMHVQELDPELFGRSG